MERDREPGVRVHRTEEGTKNYTPKSQLSSSFRPETLTELLLCRFIAALLIAVILVPARVPGESLVPTVLDGGPLVVDDRGLVDGVALEDNDPFRVAELCVGPLVRFLFGMSQGAFSGFGARDLPLLDHISLERLRSNNTMQFLLKINQLILTKKSEQGMKLT